jgi:hypothetical protein
MQLIGVRERLLTQLDAVDRAESSAAFQRSLADDLRAAEADSSPDSRWHRHLLRLMGDALARKTLSEHILFELAREMRPAPSLSAQGNDFDFVLDTAEAFARDGVPVVVSDLTHLVGVGDIVTVNGGDAISIIECKNRPMPHNPVLRGRHWRQQRRQADAATYLSTGYLSSDSQRPRIALEVDQPSRREDELLQCIEQAWRSPTGSAAAYFGERDLLIACWNRGLPVKDVFSQITINQDGWRSAVTAGSLTACANPGPFIANPYSLPLPAHYRHAIAEEALILLRCVDLQLLAGELEAGGTRWSVESTARTAFTGYAPPLAAGRRNCPRTSSTGCCGITGQPATSGRCSPLSSTPRSASLTPRKRTGSRLPPLKARYWPPSRTATRTDHRSPSLSPGWKTWAVTASQFPTQSLKR